MVYNGHNAFYVKHLQSAGDHFCHGCPDASPAIGFIVGFGVFLTKICWPPSSPLKNSFLVLTCILLGMQKSLDLGKGERLEVESRV